MLIQQVNGSAWTNVNTLNTSRSTLGGAGIQTAALAFGPSATELWNGTSWTSNPTGLGTTRNSIGGTGTQGLALAMGSDSGPRGQTEEWTGSLLAVKTITTS